ncbi:hypothetical protein J1605_017708 [Eschrichtius robustus]|uniref:SCAN box domain-containing protein n=1 Tax=Eschrichtius robustus TaxID=9764 RepID=A0AB34I142_ESCRO|nr:hypothetical protein J1605_017708 [Eschrichtius robustus]
MAAVFLPNVPEEPKELFEVTNKKRPAVGQRSGTKGSSQNNQELFCQRFQHFCYKETLRPHEALSQLCVFCCEWLRPEIHTKEQMLDLLVLEQFLTILPEELQDWAQEHQPESGEEAVALLEDLERDLDESGQQVSTQACAQEVLSETSVPLDPSKKATYLQRQPMEIQLKGESQDPLHQQDCEWALQDPEVAVTFLRQTASELLPSSTLSEIWNLLFDHGSFSSLIPESL